MSLPKTLLIVLGLTIVAGAGYFLTRPESIPTPSEPTFCTMDAMQCPDGSWVGRTGPNCEFVCPES